MTHHDDRITEFLNRVGTYSIAIDGDTLTIRKRNVGDIWLDIDGNWCGMSPEGETGPWLCSQAAAYAAEGKFKAANVANIRRF